MIDHYLIKYKKLGTQIHKVHYFNFFIKQISLMNISMVKFNNYSQSINLILKIKFKFKVFELM